MTQTPVAADWLRAFGIERVYVLSCDVRRLAAFMARQITWERPLGGVQVWEQVADTDGQRGCRLGHLGILNEAVDDALTGVLVLEDDVIFAAGFVPTLQRALAWLEHRRWDGLWLGGLPPEYRDSYDYIRVTPELVKPSWTVFTTHAYMLHGEAAITLAAHGLETEGVAADVALQQGLRATTYGVVYACSPALAGQARGTSLVTGTWRDERW